MEDKDSSKPIKPNEVVRPVGNKTNLGPVDLTHITQDKPDSTQVPKIHNKVRDLLKELDNANPKPPEDP